MSRTTWLSTAVLASAAAFAACSNATGAITLQINETTLSQGASVSLPVYATGGDSVDGVKLDIKVDNGAKVVNFDFTGTFLTGGSGFNSIPDPTGEFPQYTYADTTPPADVVSASGLVGTLILDTTGISIGQTFTVDFFFDYGSPTGSDTFFSLGVGKADLNITSPTEITVVPEPASLGLLAGAALFAIRRRRA